MDANDRRPGASYSCCVGGGFIGALKIAAAADEGSRRIDGMALEKVGRKQGIPFFSLLLFVFFALPRSCAFSPSGAQVQALLSLSLSLSIVQ